MKPHLVFSIRLAIAIAIAVAAGSGWLAFEELTPKRAFVWERDPISGALIDKTPPSATHPPISWTAYAAGLKWGSVGGIAAFAITLGACLVLRFMWHFLLARIADLSSAIRGERPDLDDSD